MLNESQFWSSSFCPFAGKTVNCLISKFTKWQKVGWRGLGDVLWFLFTFNFWSKKIIIILHGKGPSQAAVRVSIKPTATAKGGKEKEIFQRELHKKFQSLRQSWSMKHCYNFYMLLWTQNYFFEVKVSPLFYRRKYCWKDWSHLVHTCPTATTIIFTNITTLSLSKGQPLYWFPFNTITRN